MAPIAPFGWRDHDPTTALSAAEMEAFNTALGAYADSTAAATAQAELPSVAASKFGAKNDAQTVIDAAITTGTKTLTSASGLFKPGDVGKSVRLQNAGIGTKNEVKTYIVTGEPTGGTFTLNFWGTLSAPIPYNATTGEVKAAVEAIPAMVEFGAFNVEVTGTPGNWVITFVNSLGSQPIEFLTATATLTGGTKPTIAVTRTTTGVSAWYEGEITAYNSATSVTLAANASTTVTGAELVWGTDATRAINAAGEYVNEQGGGTVELKSTGAYFISYKETTKFGGTTKWGLRTWSNWRLKGGFLHFPSFTAGSSTPFISPEGMSNWHIDHVRFHGHYMTGVEVGHQTISVQPFNSAWSVTDCKSEHYGTKFVFVGYTKGTAFGTNIRVERNEISHHAGNALGFNGVEFVWVFNNFVHDIQTPDAAEWCIGNELSHFYVERNTTRKWGNTNLCYNEESNAFYVIVRNNNLQAAAPGRIAMVSIGAGPGSIAEHCHVDYNTLDCSLVTNGALPIPVKFAAGTVERCTSDDNDILHFGDGPAISWLGATVIKHSSCSRNKIKVTSGSGGHIEMQGGEGNTICDNDSPSNIQCGSYDYIAGNHSLELEVESHCVLGPNVVRGAGLRINGSYNTGTGGYYMREDTSSNGAVMIFFEGAHNHFTGATFDRPGGESLRAIYIIGTGGDNTFEACPCPGAKAQATLGVGAGNRVRRCPGLPASGAGVGTAEIPIGLTSIEITHNMGYAPTAGEIDTTPITNSGAQWWVSNITAEKFKVNIATAGPAIAKFGYVIG